MPAPRRRHARRYDGLYALTLSALLAVGIVTVLLLNTAMQTQADRIAASNHRLAALDLQIQTLRVDLDRAAVPAALAARAKALHLRPATRLPALTLPRQPVVILPNAAARKAPRRLSARAQAALRGRAG